MHLVDVPRFGRLIVWYLYIDQCSLLTAHSDTKRSIYNIQITIIHIIAFTITINYPNIVKILWLFSTNELVNFIDIGCWRSSLLQTHDSKHIVASHTGMLWNNRQFTIRVVVYIMRRHIVVHVHIWMGRVGFLFLLLLFFGSSPMDRNTIAINIQLQHTVMYSVFIWPFLYYCCCCCWILHTLMTLTTTNSIFSIAP